MEGPCSSCEVSVLEERHSRWLQMTRVEVCCGQLARLEVEVATTTTYYYYCRTSSVQY